MWSKRFSFPEMIVGVSAISQLGSCARIEVRILLALGPRLTVICFELFSKGRQARKRSSFKGHHPFW